LECQKVKVEHRNPARLLHPLPISEWKWEVVTMHFITKLPRTSKYHDYIMVVVENLTKVSHFIPVKLTVITEISSAHGDKNSTSSAHGDKNSTSSKQQ
jgi:hypothetical protein